jgi:hypothetical protein
MKIIDCYIYVSYIVYNKYIYDFIPEFTAVFTVGATSSFAIFMFTEILAAKLCLPPFEFLGYPIAATIGAFIIILYLIVYLKFGRLNRVIKDKPMLFGSFRISLLVVVISTIVFASFFFWEMPFIDNIRRRCN